MVNLAAMVWRRLLRKRWVLALVFGLSLVYFLTSTFKQVSGLSLSRVCSGRRARAALPAARLPPHVGELPGSRAAPVPGEVGLPARDRGRAEGPLLRGCLGEEALLGQLRGLEPRAVALAPVVITPVAPACFLPAPPASLPHRIFAAVLGAGGGRRPRVTAGKPSPRERPAGPASSRAAGPALRVRAPFSSGRGGASGRLAVGRPFCASRERVQLEP